MIQSCSLKNHSARNSPGQQRQLDSLRWEGDFKACTNTNSKYHSRPPASLSPLLLNAPPPTRLSLAASIPCDRVNHQSMSDVLQLCHSQVTVTVLSEPCVCVCTVHLWFLTTPRLHVASYKKKKRKKNSFSMTKWRIRLEGSGQSSGTPLKDVCPALLCSCLFICAPCMGKKKVVWRALGRVSSAAKLQLNLLRNCQDFVFFNVVVTESDTVFMRYCFLLLPVKWCQVTLAELKKKKGQADRLVIPGGRHITLNSCVLNSTCLDRTHLNKWMSFQAVDPHSCYSAVLFASLYFQPGEYSTMYNLWVSETRLGNSRL